MPRKIDIPSESDLPFHNWDPYSSIHAERIRAHKKHEAKDGSMETKDFDHPIWLAVLAEEFGEVARVLCENELGNLSEVKPELREELVQLGAMTAAWIDAIDLDLKTEPFPTDKESQQMAEAKTWAKEQFGKPYNPSAGDKRYDVSGFVKAFNNFYEQLGKITNQADIDFVRKEYSTDLVETIARTLHKSLSSDKNEEWDDILPWRKAGFRDAAVEAITLRDGDNLYKIGEFLKREGGILQLSYIGGAQEYIASCMFGREAPDSPIWGGHSIQSGESATEAIDNVAKELNL